MFRPGMEPVPPPQKTRCLYLARVNNIPVARCTDAAVPGDFYCALHLEARRAEKEARRQARYKPKKWWQF